MRLPKEIKLVLAQIRNRRKLYFGIAAAILASAMTAFIPYIYGNLVDVVMKPNMRLNNILWLVGLWFVLSLLSNIFERFSGRYAYEMATDITNKLLVDVFFHISNLPMSFHKEKKTGKIARRVQRGIDDLYQLIERTLFSFMPEILLFFVALAILFFVEWRLSLILLFSSVCYVLITFSYTKSIIKKQKAMQAGWEKAYGKLFDSILNIHAVKSSNAEDFERRQNAKNFGSAGTVYKNWRLIWTNMSFWQQLIFVVSFITVFVAGVVMLKNGQLSVGHLIMFVGYASLLTSPLSRLADQYREAKSHLDSFRRAIKYFGMTPEKDWPSARELEIKGKVIFENVSFGYKKGRETLSDISFEIEPGQTVALVGESGVGKTTITDLIGRYYLPQKGKILIDGADIKKIKLESLRSQMALVPQEVLLFNDTIKNNIKCGNPRASDEQIIEATRAANAHEFIDNFPKKYEQLVGERGIKLSTGQKQRVAIARAILRDPDGIYRNFWEMQTAREKIR